MGKQKKIQGNSNLEEICHITPFKRYDSNCLL